MEFLGLAAALGALGCPLEDQLRLSLSHVVIPVGANSASVQLLYEEEASFPYKGDVCFFSVLFDYDVFDFRIPACEGTPGADCSTDFSFCNCRSINNGDLFVLEGFLIGSPSSSPAAVAELEVTADLDLAPGEYSLWLFGPNVTSETYYTTCDLSQDLQEHLLTEDGSVTVTGSQ